MDLYRIILVDDEEEVRKSIIRKIDWQAVDLPPLSGTRRMGEDALEKIEAQSRTWSSRDIRMPYGRATLAGEDPPENPSMKIVIFSGYDDFDYAKRAIKLNVTEYILKPVNVGGELTAILRRIQESLDEEIGAKARCEPSAEIQTQPADPARAVPKDLVRATRWTGKRSMTAWNSTISHLRERKSGFHCVKAEISEVLQGS